MIRLITDYEAFLSLRKQWNALLESSLEHENVFLRHEWFDVWWRAFGAEKKMFILMYCDEEKLLGVAPLMTFRDSYKGIPYTRLGFIENPNAPSMNFIVRRDDEEKTVSGVLDHLLCRANRSWHVAVFNKIPDTSLTLKISEVFFSKNNAKHMIRKAQNSPYISVDSDWETFLKSTSVKFRKQLRNKINKLNNAGEVRFEVWGDVGTDRQHLDDAMSVSSLSWKHCEGTSMTSTPERRRFFELLSDAATRNGWLRIWLLYLNGKPIAMEYHLEYKGRTHAMRGDFDESYDSLSPGSVLEAYIIEHCFRNKLKEYNFCGLDYKYKRRWTPNLCAQSNLLFYNLTPYSRILYIVQKYLPIVKSRWVEIRRREKVKGER